MRVDFEFAFAFAFAFESECECGSVYLVGAVTHNSSQRLDVRLDAVPRLTLLSVGVRVGDITARIEHHSVRIGLSDTLADGLILL